MDTKRRSLLQKYDIPISHLDFDYIKNCTNTKELERILTVLRSGEEGHFPDLTQFAEDKLRELKPSSKILRTEEPLPTKSRLSTSEWKEANEPFIEWANEIKIKDKFLSTISESSDDIQLNYPPIREQTKKIDINKKEEIENGQKSSSGRIKSTDYREWDKYDPDTEILKMELKEERIKEEVERKNRVNTEKLQNASIKPLPASDEKEIFEKLTNVEKDNLATRYKERGNDYFKAREYENAIKEYTRCLNIVPSAAGYNNRAVAYLKMFQYKKCIEDCDKCVKIEPKNIKALLRKAQAFMGLDEKYKACEVYARVISIEPSNVVARNNLNDLRSKLYVPPADATHIPIQDEPGEVTNREIISSNLEEENTKKKETHKTQGHKPNVTHVQPEEDFSKLIVPNKIVKSKLASAVQTLGQLNKNKQKTQSERIQKKQPQDLAEKSEIKFFSNKVGSKNEILIQEIGN